MCDGVGLWCIYWCSPRHRPRNAGMFGDQGFTGLEWEHDWMGADVHAQAFKRNATVHALRRLINSLINRELQVVFSPPKLVALQNSTTEIKITLKALTESSIIRQHRGNLI